ncbi:hypothetical protein [Oceaniglobus indicus]|nr:hypothetical protein [Oceaniglobus indicus]
MPPKRRWLESALKEARKPLPTVPWQRPKTDAAPRLARDTAPRVASA